MTHATVAGTVRGSRRLGPLYQRGTRGEGGGTSRGWWAGAKAAREEEGVAGLDLD
uniref:Uncharacterized protein n=1 Tax=Oryza sativa subsp. japonica TaxID=39947 RepID=Q6Z375_ORYSJ|nr:hypothetical protein [Oryza sativa Japonica Group]BAD31242.1 hypothetical protein [Oryza sativa Japonica Group]